MYALPHNTISKLFYFDSRIKSFYQKHGYSSIPLDSREVQKMIDDSQKETKELFHKIWGSSMGYHLLGKFWEFRGNILEFYMSLDENNRQLFSNKDW